MNLKQLLLVSCFAAVIFSASVALADGHARAMRSQPAITRSAPRFTPNARSTPRTFQHWNGNWNRGTANWNRGTANWNRGTANWNRGSSNWSRGNRNWSHWNGDWRRRHFRNRIVFIGGFGYPFGYPWYYPYSYYGYYPYYQSGYYPYGYSSYDPYSSYDSAVYQGGVTYGDDAAYEDDATYSNGRAYGGATANASIVAQVQRSLAREGYYKGAIDGEMGPRTYYAIRAFQRSHDLRVDGTINSQLLTTMGLR
jgi:Putative peptidoglycan binding domain